MSTTVGLLNHSGIVGSNLLKALTARHQSGEIKLVVFHRPDSKTPIPDEVEKRVLDLANGDPSVTEKAIEDIQIFLSALGGEQIPLQATLVDALSKSKKLITFAPSEYGVDWNEEDYKIPQLGFLIEKEKIVKRANEKNVPITIFQTGGFAEFAEVPFNAFGVGVKGNEVDVYGDNLKNQFVITSVPYIAEAVAQLITSQASSLPGKTYHLHEFSHTGSEFVELLTKLHGKEPTYNQWDDAKYEAVLKSGGLGSLGARIRWKWAHGFTWGGERYEVKGWKGQSLEERWKAFLAKA